MKSIKNAVAVVIKDESGKFLVVKRPETEQGPLAGVWGFPAVSLMENESEEAAVVRVGRAKLGVDLQPLEKIGSEAGDRGSYELRLSDYAASIIKGVPTVPQPDTAMTQYVDYKYVDDPKVLFPAAEKGSLCSRVYLKSISVDWQTTN